MFFFSNESEILQEQIRQKALNIWRNKWSMHYEKGPSYVALLVQQFLVGLQFQC